MTDLRTTVPDLADPRTHLAAEMPDLWRRLRDDDPVHWHPGRGGTPGFWVLTRYDDIVRVLTDSATFESARGNVLATMLLGDDAGAGRMLAVSDGDYHTELRRVLMPAFTPRALHGVRRRIRQTVRRLLVRAAAEGGCDFATDVAAAIPLQTICDLLDVPARDRMEILRLTQSALASDGEAPQAEAERMSRSAILEYFGDLVAVRRRSPGSDPISLMAAARVAGRRLDDEDIVLNCYSLIMGGDETSRLAMIGAVRALIEHPDQWAALRDGGADVSGAVEEVLRWTTPTLHFGRTVTATTRMRDRTLERGDLVTLWLVSANQDERVFPAPDRFDLSRSPNRHLALGHGTHFCLGALLGRLEIGAMLDGLRTFVRSMAAAGPGRRIYSNFVSGMSSLPIVLTPDENGPSRWRD